jgi:hypothetical protein
MRGSTNSMQIIAPHGVAKMRNYNPLTGGEAQSSRWFEDEQDLNTALAESIENGEFPMDLTHVKQWRKADKLSSSDDNEVRNQGEQAIEQLMDAWLGTEWFIAFERFDTEIVGTLKEINRYGYMGEFAEPAFTFEFNDPDNPEYLMRLTAHYARFQQAPK